MKLSISGRGWQELKRGWIWAGRIALARLLTWCGKRLADAAEFVAPPKN
jgi:hypothetical protein